VSTPLIVLLGFVAALFCVAMWSRRETQTMEGYFLAGKRLPFWVVAFSTNATGESGWLLLGLTGMGYAVGAQALWVVVGEVMGVTLAWTLIARRFKRMSDEAGALTVPDVIVAHFGDRSHVLRITSVLIILAMVSAYVTAQMAAAGKALVGFTDIDYTSAVLFGGSAIILYTIIGGFKAVSYTDVLQGVLMLFGLILVPLMAVQHAGGIAAVLEALGRIDTDLLSMTSALNNELSGWILLISFLAIGLPFLGVPQLMTRFMAAANDQELKKARGVSIIVILLFDLGAVATGMVGRVLFPELADQETVFPMLARTLFTPVITGLLLVVVVSAIMSTVDSLLLLASSAVVRDTMQQIFASKKTDQSLARIGKGVTLAIGVLGITFAIEEVRFLFWFILFAWSGLGAAFGPVVLCMLYDKRTTHAGAVSGMLFGFLLTVVWVLEFKARTYELYEMIPGFFGGLLLTWLVSRLTQHKHG